VIWFRRRPVWIVAAWAALMAQSAPTAFCSDCDRPCCAARTGAGESQACTPGTESPDGCTLCATHFGLAPAESSEQPCDCQLDARQEQPLAFSRPPLADHQDDAPAMGPAAVPSPVPQTLGITREFQAASLAAPIRPARILFGVWRN
jgi:hypothetical protein